MIRALQIKGLSVLGFLTATSFAASSLMKHPVSWLPWIILAVGLQSMAAFWALLWALPKSNRAFFSVFAGDALLRSAGLGIATYWLLSNRLPPAPPLLTLAFSYLLFSLVQIPFFCRVR